MVSEPDMGALPIEAITFQITEADFLVKADGIGMGRDGCRTD